jgi:PadR family transcriptional regulator PadR
VRRKTGSLVPLEMSIVEEALELRASRITEFHGYAIAARLADASNRRLLTAYGTLYRALGRLEQMGLLTSRQEDPQIAAAENRPVRRLYSLTEQGAVAARAARAARAPARRSRFRRKGEAPA